MVEGKGYFNRAAYAIHSPIYKGRPDLNGSIHLHSMYGKSWSTTGRLLKPINQDECSMATGNLPGLIPKPQNKLIAK